MCELIIAFGGRQGNLFGKVRPGAQGPLLRFDGVFNHIGVKVCKIHLTGLEGRGRNGEDQLTVPGLGNAVEGILSLAEVRGAVARIGNLPKRFFGKRVAV